MGTGPTGQPRRTGTVGRTGRVALLRHLHIAAANLQLADECEPGDRVTPPLHNAMLFTEQTLLAAREVVERKRIGRIGRI